MQKWRRGKSAHQSFSISLIQIETSIIQSSFQSTIYILLLSSAPFQSYNHTLFLSTQDNARYAQHVNDDQGTSQQGSHDCATNAGQVPQRYLLRPAHSRNASDTGAPGQLGRVAVIGGSEKSVKSICAPQIQWIRTIDYRAATPALPISQPWHPHD